MAGGDDVYVYPAAVKKEGDGGAWGGPAAAGDEPPVAPLEFGSRQFSRAEERRINMELMEDVPQRDIRTRPGPGGQKLHYLAGWKSVEIANRIFGFNGWSENTVTRRTNFCEQMPNGRWAACVTASVRVTLKDGTYREDTGGGSAENLKSRQDCIMLAEKEAVTDARKRALKNFGRRLGLSLYDDEFLRDLASDNAKKIKAMKEKNAAKHAQAAGGHLRQVAAGSGVAGRQVLQRQAQAQQPQRGLPAGNLRQAPPSTSAGGSVRQAPPLASSASSTKENPSVHAQVKQTVAEVNKRTAQIELQWKQEEPAPQANAASAVQAGRRNPPPAQLPSGLSSPLSAEEEQKRKEARILKARLMQEQAKKNRAALKAKPRSAERNMFIVGPAASPGGAPGAVAGHGKPGVAMSPVTPGFAGNRQLGRSGMASPSPGQNPHPAQKRSLNSSGGPLPRTLNALDRTPQPHAKVARRNTNPAASFTTAKFVAQPGGSSMARRPRTKEEEARILEEYADANNV